MSLIREHGGKVNGNGGHYRPRVDHEERNLKAARAGEARYRTLYEAALRALEAWEHYAVVGSQAAKERARAATAAAREK